MKGPEKPLRPRRPSPLPWIVTALLLTVLAYLLAYALGRAP